MKNKLLTLLSVAVLSACGGSGGTEKVEDDSTIVVPPPPPPVMKEMRVIPALSGAQVCVDANADLVCQSGEVVTTTSSDGSFEIEEADKSEMLIIKSIDITVKSETGESVDWTFYGTGDYDYITPFTSFAAFYQTPIEQQAGHFELSTDDLVADYKSAYNLVGATQEQLISFAINEFLIEYIHSDDVDFTNNGGYNKIIAAMQKVARYVESGVTMEDLTFRHLKDGSVAPIMPEALVTNFEDYKLLGNLTMYSFGEGSGAPFGSSPTVSTVIFQPDGVYSVYTESLGYAESDAKKARHLTYVVNGTTVEFENGDVWTLVFGLELNSQISYVFKGQKRDLGGNLVPSGYHWLNVESWDFWDMTPSFLKLVNGKSLFSLSDYELGFDSKSTLKIDSNEVSYVYSNGHKVTGQHSSVAGFEYTDKLSLGSVALGFTDEVTGSEYKQDVIFYTHWLSLMLIEKDGQFSMQLVSADEGIIDSFKEGILFEGDRGTTRGVKSF